MTRPFVALVVVLALGGAGCTERVTPADELLTALNRTAEQPQRFHYVDRTADRTLSVSGAVEDGLRREAAVEIDGRSIYHEVVAEDSLAVRIDDPLALDLLGDEGEPESADGLNSAAVEAELDKALAEVDVAPELAELAEALGDAAVETLEGATAGPQAVVGDTAVRELLLSGVWIEDEIGAPSLLSTTRVEPGDDPVFDALHVFDDIRAAIDESSGVVRYNPDDLAYRPDEDPFPPPDQGVVRYDLVRPDLPGGGAITSSGVRVPPEPAHFRKLSVYVRDGLVVEVRDLIDVSGLLDELAKEYDIQAPEGADRDAAVAAVVDRINVLRAAAGEPPLEARERHLELSDVGSDVRIGRPDTVTIASLLLLKNRGSSTGIAPSRVASDTPPETATQPPGGASGGTSNGGS